MPTPARTSLEGIVLAARSILDADGLEALTMARVAEAVGVRSPSLYKHVTDRSSLIHLVANDAARDLGDRVIAATGSGDPRGDLRAMLDAFRAFAHERPAAYGLLFDRVSDGWRADADLIARAVDPLFVAVEAVSGPSHRLEAARTLVAWARGFVAMELAGAFQLGGSVEDAYRYGVDRLVGAIAAAD